MIDTYVILAQYKSQRRQDENDCGNQYTWRMWQDHKRPALGYRRIESEAQESGTVHRPLSRSLGVVHTGWASLVSANKNYCKTYNINARIA